MSYLIEVPGAFELEPPLGPEGRAALVALGKGWSCGTSGRLLFLPSDNEYPDVLESLREIVATLLPRFGVQARGTLEWIGEDGGKGWLTIRNNAIEVESAAEEELSREYVAELCRVVGSGTLDQKREAIEVFENCQPVGPEVVEALMGALGDPAMNVRLDAANALFAFGPRAEPALLRLIDALGDPEPWVQAAAAQAIGGLGAPALEAVPKLTELTRHPNYGPAGRAREALERILKPAR